eukprot:2334889-Amphidinium_carterae.1
MSAHTRAMVQLRHAGETATYKAKGHSKRKGKASAKQKGGALPAPPPGSLGRHRSTSLQMTEGGTLALRLQLRQKFLSRASYQ